MTLHVADLNDEHLDFRLATDALVDVPELSTENVMLIVSEKYGEDNNGYLVAELPEWSDFKFWCACDGFRFHCIDNGHVSGECKHIRAVKKRKREAVEADQVTLGGDAE